MDFINRKFELELLNKKLEHFRKGIWLNTSHLAFLGLRRTGKTYLVKYFLNNLKNINNKDVNNKDIISIFIDVSKFKENIKYFCDNILMEFAKNTKETYLDIPLDLFFNEYENGDFYSLFRNYSLQKDNFEIFNKFLSFLTQISLKNKLIIIFDEFQDILEFTKLKGLKNLDDIFRSELQNQTNIFYIITGSYPSILRDLIQNPKKKLYSHFDIYDIKNFDKESSIDLINIFNKNLTLEQKNALYKSCNGNPYLISLILEKVDISLLGNLENNFKNLLFDRKGSIYNHYEYILEESLSKIQNSIVLKAILKEISLSENGILLKELSLKIGYTPQQIFFGIKQLLKIDIIYQTVEKKWKFQDVLFSYFIAYSMGGIENYEFEKNSYYISFSIN